MQRIKVILIGIASIVGGIYFLITTYTAYVDNQEFKSRMAETKATVTDVESYQKEVRSGSKRHRRYEKITLYRTDFEYEANGEIFTGVTDFRDPIQIHDRFSVFYDKSNPSDFRSSPPPSSFGVYIFSAIIGGLFLLFGGVIFHALWATRESKS